MAHGFGLAAPTSDRPSPRDRSITDDPTPKRTRFGSSALAGPSYAVAMRYQRAEPPLKLDGLDAARRFFASCFADTDPSRESLWVAHLDREARCLHVSHHDGEPAGAPFPVRSDHRRCRAPRQRGRGAGAQSPERRCDAQRKPTAGRPAAWPKPAQAIDLTVVDHRHLRRVGMPQLPPDGPALGRSLRPDLELGRRGSHPARAAGRRATNAAK